MAEQMQPPRLSVVVPVHEGSSYLERSIPALAVSSESRFECIVVDDGSSEPVRVAPGDSRFRLLRLDAKGGPARARNHGAAYAQAELLVFLDADVVVHEDTLARLRDRLEQNPDLDAVIGSYDDAPTEPGFVSQFKNLFHHYIHQRSRPEATTFWSGCGAIRRRTFAELGGFDARFDAPSVEDIDLGYRLRAAEKRIALDPSIQVTHLKRWSLGSMIRTDVFARAIPWLLLMMRERSMPADLNATTAHRVSVVLVGLLAVCVALAAIAPARAGVAALAAGALLLLLNGDLYAFLARARGPWFAARAIPLHWLYYAYCGVAVAVAIPLHFASRRAILRSTGGQSLDSRT